MPPREWRLRIEDILEAAARIDRYVEHKDLAAFESDDRTLDAVSRCFGIIGEAATHVPAEVIAAHSEIPWAEMRSMRNVVVHEYFGVTNETLWKTAREDLPAIVDPLRRVLERSSSGGKRAQAPKASELPRELLRVIEAYVSIAPPDLQVQGAAKRWRNVYVSGWPTEIHYEFLWRSGKKIGVELHCGGSAGEGAARALQAKVAALRESLPGVAWDAAFHPGAGRLELVFEADSDPRVIAEAMLALVRATRVIVEDVLRARGIKLPTSN